VAQNENPDPNPAEEPAIARQARTIEKIDQLVKGDEPIGMLHAARSGVPLCPAEGICRFFLTWNPLEGAFLPVQKD
jgi:hypothetical protein